MRLSRPGFNRTSGKERIPTRTHFYRWLIWSRSWGDFQSHQRSLSAGGPTRTSRARRCAAGLEAKRISSFVSVNSARLAESMRSLICATVDRTPTSQATTALRQLQTLPTATSTYSAWQALQDREDVLSA